MKILSLELKGYLRFEPNHISYLKLNTVEATQLILGSNGSGKSSLLKELTPLPATLADYSKDGNSFKEIIIIHKRSKYILRSQFFSSPKHFFNKDGEEMNLGGTGQVQKDLVFKEFGITPFIHDIFTGKVKFHNMSLAQRREWFSISSKVDYAYAMGVYKSMKEKARDLQGVMRVSQSRLMLETDKLLDGKQEEEMRNQIMALKELELELANMRVNVKPLNDSYARLFEVSRGLIVNATNELNTLIKKSQSINLVNYKDIDSELIKCRVELGNNESELNKIAEASDKYTNVLKAMKGANADNINELKLRRDSLSKEVIELNDALILPTRFSSVKEAIGALNSVRDTLFHIFSNVDEFDPMYTRSNHALVLENITSAKTRLDFLKETENKLLISIENYKHSKEHNKTECPQCKHSWSRGFDENKFQDAINNLNSTRVTIELTKTSIKELEIKSNQIAEYAKFYSDYRSIAASWPILNPLWEYFAEKSLLHKNPRHIPNIVDKLSNDLPVQLKIQEVEKNLTDINTLINSIGADSVIALDELTSKIEELDNKCYTLNQKHSHLVSCIKDINTYKGIINQTKELKYFLETELKVRNTLINEWGESEKQIILTQILSIIRNDVSSKEKTIMQVDVQRKLVSELTANINNSKDELESLNRLCETLSPSEGLIAKGLKAFINKFISNQNEVIKSIWAYPLEITLENDGADDEFSLDYKFGLNVHGVKNAPDISKGSSGIVEIIDLAFKIVSMQYLDMLDYPLYFDEFGANMDSYHRQAAFSVISNLSVSDNFSQIYIISHHENNYGSLKNVDVSVLCPLNIVLPKNADINKNMVLK
jgi:hypothetical protein